MAYAALGAAEVLRVQPGNRVARALLLDARTLLACPTDPTWPWPDARLTYANAVLPEALVAIGAALGDDDTLHAGLDLLHWLVAQETHDDHLSLTPAAAGRTATGDPASTSSRSRSPPWPRRAGGRSARRVRRSGSGTSTGASGGSSATTTAAWCSYDDVSGAGFDGLHAHGVNQNQGAESTLAALSTLQLGRLALVQAVA